jgi:serine/threonine protein kinase
LVAYDKLGSGCFGSVYRGTYKLKNGRNVQEVPVAIKQLNIDTEESKREITKEADLMKSLNNPHIIKFIGMCFHSNGSLMIVLELAKLGPLHKYLRTHKEDVSMVKIVKICYQVAIAMQYLASKNLVHRDLAARNVLLVSEDLAKVSDFGMSRKMDENKYYETQSQGKWPLKWYPPDAISQSKFDEKSDVWSFGVTCWEATSYGCRPYQGIDIAMLLLKLENGHRLEKPPLCPDEIYNIMYKCWDANKRHRPTFTHLVRELKSVIYDLYQIRVENT